VGESLSQFIGETEKNLDRVFDMSERNRMILFFDQADVLMGNAIKSQSCRHLFDDVRLAGIEKFGDDGFELSLSDDFDPMPMIAMPMPEVPLSCSGSKTTRAG
jgi:hypothetical protein